MNETIFFFFYNLAHRSVFFDRLVVFTAEILPYIVIILAGVFLLMHHEVFKAESTFQIFMQKKKEILFAFFSAGIAVVVSLIIKFLIHNPRPFLALANVSALFPETGFSFPSSHASFFSALAVTIFLVHKKAGYLFMSFALIIGLARIIAGVHFPIDILGGFILGTLVAYFVKNV